MSAPRWIDKLRGLLQREDSPPASTGADQSSSSVVDEVTPTPPASSPGPAPAPAFVAPEPRPIPRPQAPRVPRPAPVPIPDARAFTETALQQIGATGNRLLTLVQRESLKVTPGLDHDFALLLLGYGMVHAAANVALAGAAEPLRHLRAQMRSALLAALRKHNHRTKPEEQKLGAEMVSYVDDQLNWADSAASAILDLKRSQNARPYEPMYARLAAPFGGEAPPDDLHARFGAFLNAEFDALQNALRLVPTI